MQKKEMECCNILEVIESNTQGLAPLKVIDEGIICLCGFLWVFLRKIDKIRAMR